MEPPSRFSASPLPGFATGSTASSGGASATPIGSSMSHKRSQENRRFARLPIDAGALYVLAAELG